MVTFETKLRVRYGETDQMGYMYYGNYPEIYEVARAELLRSVDYTYKKLEEQGIMMPVIELNMKYHKPARYDDEITIKTHVKKLPGVRISLNHEIFNEQGELLNTAEITLVLVNMKTNRPCLPPDDFVNKFRPYFLD